MPTRTPTNQGTRARDRRSILLALAAMSLAACGGQGSSTLPDPSPESSRAAHRDEPATPEALTTATPDATAPDAAAPDAMAEPTRAAFEPGATITLPVPGDKDVLLVHGAPGDRRAFIYLHGKCGDVRAFGSWAGAASKLGTLAALLGDERCEGTQRYRFSRDLALLDRRVTSALRAASEIRGEALDDRAVTLIGYSGGASRAAALASRFPDRYPRLLLIAAPAAPAAGSLKAARAVVFIAGERDRREHLREAAEAMARAGRPATFMLLPGAAHGEYGPEASRVMGDALAWAFAKAP
jgi:pimeloyl-ACP methyl ester carboxylesterase/predicted small lipoprotein YifL